MARRGPRLKVVRRLGTVLPGLTRKESDRKPYPPGQHGQSRTRRRKSDYRLQLEEKQKVRYHYGVTESQLLRYFTRATREPGVTGDALLALLERRLDNVVFRLGFAPTIPAARQLVSHGHVKVNGKRVNRPAFLVDPGESIALDARARTMPSVVESVEHGPQVKLPSYLELDPDDKFAGRVISTPSRPDVPFIVDQAAIVEFYAK